MSLIKTIGSIFHPHYHDRSVGVAVQCVAAPPHVGRLLFCREVICDSSKTRVSTTIGTLPPPRSVSRCHGHDDRVLNPQVVPRFVVQFHKSPKARCPPLFPRRIGRCSICPRIRRIRVSALRHTHDGGVVRDSVLMISCDCRAYRTPPFPRES